MEIESAIEIWNDLCFHINKHKNSLEKEFQRIVVSFFEKLGWSSHKGEIISQQTIPIGAAQRLIPDIIIKENDKEVIVIELKKNNASNSSRTQQQLFSYMHQLKLKFGMFIGENLQFYYDKPDDNGQPIEIFETDFTSDNEEAAKFISLISKPFGEDKLLEFCNDRILTPEDKLRLKELKVKIFKGFYEGKAKALFIDFLRKEYNEQIANKIRDEIEVEVEVEDNTFTSDLVHPDPNSSVKNIYHEVKDYIKSLGNNNNIISDKECQRYWSFKKNSKYFVGVQLRKNEVVLMLELDLKRNEIEEGFTRDMRKINAFAPGNLEIRIENERDLKKAKQLIKRAYAEN
ncbi:hypothetical protein R83H12_01839 [Fibrobacteria bacterium R8-3-H12]